MTGYRVPPRVADLSSVHVPDAEWWYSGAAVGNVRECAVLGCEPCQQRLGWLVDHLDGVAPDGEHATIDSFAEAD